MLTAIRLDTQGNGVVSDGLHRVILPAVVVEALRAATAEGAACLEVDAHQLVVIPLAPEATATEGVEPPVLADPLSPPAGGHGQAAQSGGEVVDGVEPLAEAQVVVDATSSPVAVNVTISLTTARTSAGEVPDVG